MLVDSLLDNPNVAGDERSRVCQVCDLDGVARAAPSESKQRMVGLIVEEFRSIVRGSSVDVKVACRQGAGLKAQIEADT